MKGEGVMVWCVVCGVWCVVCGVMCDVVWCVVCGVWGGVWCVVCLVWGVGWGVGRGGSWVWCVVCGVWGVRCWVRGLQGYRTHQKQPTSLGPT